MNAQGTLSEHFKHWKHTGVVTTMTHGTSIICCLLEQWWHSQWLADSPTGSHSNAIASTSCQVTDARHPLSHPVRGGATNTTTIHITAAGPAAPTPIEVKTSRRPRRYMKEAERRAKLENDILVLQFNKGWVRCGVCEDVKILEKQTPYQLSNWTRHRATCLENHEVIHIPLFIRAWFRM